MKQSPMSPGMRTCSYWMQGVLLALTAALIMEGSLSFHLAVTYLISINVLTPIYYWIDKINGPWADKSKSNESREVRIPEVSLLLLALCGGSLGAFVAMVLLNHKTNKVWFLTRFALILVFHGIAVYSMWDKLPWA